MCQNNVDHPKNIGPPKIVDPHWPLRLATNSARTPLGPILCVCTPHLLSSPDHHVFELKKNIVEVAGDYDVNYGVDDVVDDGGVDHGVDDGVDDVVDDGVNDGVDHGVEHGVEHGVDDFVEEVGNIQRVGTPVVCPPDGGVDDGVNDGVDDDGVDHGVDDGVDHVVDDGVNDGVDHGVDHGVEHGVEHGVDDGVDDFVEEVGNNQTVGTPVVCPPPPLPYLSVQNMLWKRLGITRQSVPLVSAPPPWC